MLWRPVQSLPVMLMLVVLVNTLGWAWLGHTAEPEPLRLGGLAYSGFRDGQDPFQQIYPSPAEIAEDLELLAGITSRIRTYAALESEPVLRAAQARDLQVTLGIWLDKDRARNEAELAAALRLVRTYRNVDALVVGNETLLRGDLTSAQLRAYVERVQAATTIPVTTAETWHNWTRHPELARAVDFLTVHILPYWEGLPVDAAMPFLAARYDELRARYPDKRLVIGETGWPSAGPPYEAAFPGEVAQRQYLEAFLALAQERQLEYFYLEAFDQPWKVQEGPVGPHWGLFTSERQLKPALRPPPSWLRAPWWHWAIGTTLVAGLLIAAVARGRHLRPGARLALWGATQAAVSALPLIALGLAHPTLAPLERLAAAPLALGVLCLLAIQLAGLVELLEVRWPASPARRFAPKPVTPLRAPFVSIHIPIANEPPEVVRATLDALAQLDYPHYEVIVVDNNTRERSVWEPVRTHCFRLGPRFRFFHVEVFTGYKAEALNFALAQTDPQAEVIGVLDSDYQVEPDWLRALVGYFAQPTVAFVQAPQDYRDWAAHPIKTWRYWEYKAFFEVGMVQRNEHNAIILHGTMVLLRRAALEAVGGWDQDSVVEDAELGLRLLAHGYDSVYVRHCFGRGLVPHSQAAYMRQRFRWAFGAIQILRAHWPMLLLPGQGRLKVGQRLQFLAGWVFWLGDALHAAFAGAAGLTVLGMLLSGRAWEPALWWLGPGLAAVALQAARSAYLYRRHMQTGWGETFGAALAAMSLIPTVGRAYLVGCLRQQMPFYRTPKAEGQSATVRSLGTVKIHGIVGGGLVLLGGALVLIGPLPVGPAVLWAFVLILFSLPFLAGVAIALGEALQLPLRRLQDWVFRANPVQRSEYSLRNE